MKEPIVLDIGEEIIKKLEELEEKIKKLKKNEKKLSNPPMANKQV